MKKTPQVLQAICQSIADGAKPLDAALLNDVSARAFFLWLRQSKENADPSLVIDWQGQRLPFATAVQNARLAAVRGDPVGLEAPSGATVVHHYHHFIFEPAKEPAPRAEPEIDAELEEMLHGSSPQAIQPTGPSAPEASPGNVSASVIPDEPEAAPIPDKVAEPERVPDRAARPLAFDEPPNRPPRSDLERDLLARLAAARARNAPATANGSGEPEGSPAPS